MRIACVLLTLGLAATCTGAQPLAPQPAPPDAGIAPALNAALPLDLAFTDSDGHAITLRQAFHDRPVLLVPGYYRCPQLCGLLMQDLLQALQRSGLPRDAYRVLRISIDPDETPADARTRREADLAYARFLAPTAAPPDLRALTGSAPAVQALAQRLGYRYQRNDDEDGRRRWAHAAVAIVATPQGRISSYVSGIGSEPAQLRLALVRAGDGRAGNLSDRVALLCAHLDPRLGRHSAAVLLGLQAMGLLLVLGLGAAWWRLSVHRPSHEAAP